MRVEVLGNVQDGGVPHLGCSCSSCSEARQSEADRYVTSLMLRENTDDDTVRYLIDATPDIRYQVDGEYLDGVFVPHASLGHMIGLLFFGKEGMDADRLSVYCTEEVEHYLMNNDPFRKMFDRENIQSVEFESGDVEKLQGGEIEASTFEHPQAGHPTTAYLIRGEERKLFYLSDITGWTEEILEMIEEADIAVVDGTFWSQDEIDRYEEVPHPTIEESMDLMENLETDVYFTHLNHTNPALREGSDERDSLESRGFGVAEAGVSFEI